MRPKATKNMIVYSKATGVRRRVHDADHDNEYAYFEKHVHPGEGFFYLTHEKYDAHLSPLDLNETTAKKAGFDKAPEHHADRHAIVDPNGIVVGTCHADLTCGDSGEHIAPGHTLILHEHADGGWKHIGNGVIVPPDKEE